MNIQKLVMPFNKVLVTIDHESFGASFELPLTQTNIEDVCQRVIAKEVATEARSLANDGQMNLLAAVRSGLSICHQIESEAEVSVYTPNTDVILEYTKAFITCLSDKNLTTIDNFEAEHGSLPKELKEYLQTLIK